MTNLGDTGVKMISYMLGQVDISNALSDWADWDVW
jgi:hypothetical protein